MLDILKTTFYLNQIDQFCFCFFFIEENTLFFTLVFFSFFVIKKLLTQRYINIKIETLAATTRTIDLWIFENKS